MSVSNVNMFEFHDEDKANYWISWYKIAGPDGFNQAEIMLFVRTGPTFGVAISVYPNDDARQAGSETRIEIQRKQAEYIKDISVFEGDVQMKYIK